jgi:hypothetical protein
MLPTLAPAADRVFYLVRNAAASRAYVSGVLWSVNLATGERSPVIRSPAMSNYSISQDGTQVVFTSAGERGGDGVWIGDLDGRRPPRPLTRGSEYRAMPGPPGEIVYMTETEVRHLYRMRDDGSGVEMISPEPVVHLVAVSPDGKWALATQPQASQVDGSKLAFFPLTGGTPYIACDQCVLGFGPVRQQAPMFNWSPDGKSLFRCAAVSIRPAAGGPVAERAGHRSGRCGKPRCHGYQRTRCVSDAGPVAVPVLAARHAEQLVPDSNPGLTFKRLRQRFASRTSGHPCRHPPGCDRLPRTLHRARGWRGDRESASEWRA